MNGSLIYSRGLLIFLLFQILSLAVILLLVVIMGAVCGAGIFSLRHKQPRGKSLGKSGIGEYLPVVVFSTREGITEERALARIKSGYYQGGLIESAWYIHKAELSQSKAL